MHTSICNTVGRNHRQPILPGFSFKSACRTTLTLIFIFALLSCSSSDSSNNPSNVTMQGTRVLGMDIKEVPSVTYSVAYEQAMSIGVREVSVSLDWSTLEPSLGNYDNSLPDIIELYYPSQVANLTLVLRPLDTPGPSLPVELTGKNYDDPAVISAFENLLVNLHSRIPTMNASGKLKWIQVGNEIDAWLGTDTVRWQQWLTFFKAIKARIHSLWGNDIAVSSIIQFSVFSDPAIKSLYLTLLPELDNAAMTYYPLNTDLTMRPVSTVSTDFDTMVTNIKNKSVLLQECGYPSSSINHSSEAQQAEFITAVFEAWDKHADRFEYIDIAWQYDVSNSTVDQWVIDYGMSGNPNEAAFRAYLGTLGLNSYDSSEKAAMQQLRDELQSRNWTR